MNYDQCFDFFSELALLVNNSDRYSARSVAQLAVRTEGSPWKVSRWRPFAVASFADRVARAAAVLGFRHPYWVFESVANLDANIILRRAGEDETGWESAWQAQEVWS